MGDGNLQAAAKAAEETFPPGTQGGGRELEQEETKGLHRKSVHGDGEARTKVRLKKKIKRSTSGTAAVPTRTLNSPLNLESELMMETKSARKKQKGTFSTASDILATWLGKNTDNGGKKERRAQTFRGEDCRRELNNSVA